MYVHIPLQPAANPWGAMFVVETSGKVSELYYTITINGLDPFIGVKHITLEINAFMYGITRTMLAMIAIRYMMIVDWPMNIGRKPNFFFFHNIPSFVPILFEFTF